MKPCSVSACSPERGRYIYILDQGADRAHKRVEHDDPCGERLETVGDDGDGHLDD